MLFSLGTVTACIKFERYAFSVLVFRHCFVALKNSMGLNNEKINSRIKNGQIISDYLEKLMNIQGLLKC